LRGQFYDVTRGRVGGAVGGKLRAEGERFRRNSESKKNGDGRSARPKPFQYALHYVYKRCPYERGKEKAQKRQERPSGTCYGDGRNQEGASYW